MFQNKYRFELQVFRGISARVGWIQHVKVQRSFGSAQLQSLVGWHQGAGLSQFTPEYPMDQDVLAGYSDEMRERKAAGGERENKHNEYTSGM